jgi:hypothetical protein
MDMLLRKGMKVVTYSLIATVAAGLSVFGIQGKKVAGETGVGFSIQTALADGGGGTGGSGDSTNYGGDHGGDDDDDDDDDGCP